MSAAADTILYHLKSVDAERARRSAVPGLEDRIFALKTFQQRRFSHTYADLLKSARYGPAARFFLDELYGPRDYTRRDTQFARVVPALVRLFPSEIVDTVRHLSELHALSETLDTAMALQLDSVDVTPLAYIRAWQQVGGGTERQTQIAMTLDVARRLDRLTRKLLLRQSLHLMRGPARAAGLGELQAFLEAGFDTFRTMKGAEEFLVTVRTREEALAAALYAADRSEATGAAKGGDGLDRADTASAPGAVSAPPAPLSAATARALAALP